MSHKIIQGDNVATLKTFADNSIDSIITDPPYGIEFLGKDWDSNTGAVETWQECLRVLKPGGYLLAFSAARTYHHLATNIESVGFEIRDQLMWLYASGFPKAQDIGKAIDRRQGKKDPNFKGTETFNLTFGENPGQRLCAVCKKDQTAVYKCDRKDCGQRYQTQTPEAQQWSGWKTALKPAHEPIVMARKPFKGSTIDNVLAHGVGALNIDASRIATDESIKGARASMQTGAPHFQGTDTNTDNDAVVWKQNEQGRFPANVVGEVEGYQKYFYCPKVSRKERHCGFEQDPISHLDMVTEMGGYYVDENGNKDESKNGGGNMIWLPHLGKIYTHGLKHEYEEWCKKNKRDPLAHITHPDFSRKKDENGNPVKENSSWMYDKGGVEKIKKATDSLAHIPAPFGDVKGAYQDGERFAAKHQKLQDPLAHIKTGGNFGDALKGDGEMWGKHQKSQDPLAHIPADSTGKRYYCEIEQRKAVGNNHPTVKPVALMRWLINLVTPKNSKVLDPFSGSGSTGMAAVELGHEFVGCELDPNYVAIANRRIEGWNRPKPNNSTFEDIFDASE